MSVLFGIAALFVVIFVILSALVGETMSAGRRPRVSLRSRPDPTQPQTKMQLLIEGEGFEPDSQLRFAAWHLPDGRGSHHHTPVESARPHDYRSSSFTDVAFEPPITLAVYSGEGEPHDIKVIATDDRGNAAEAWMSGRDFYLRKEAGVVG